MDAAPTAERRILLTGVAVLAGAMVGGVAVGVVAGLVAAGLQGPPTGLEGLLPLAVGAIAASIASYPGAVLGAWLAVRRRARARRTVALVAVGYPVVGVLYGASILGLTDGRIFVPLEPLAAGIALGIGAASRALALRGASSPAGA